MTTHLTDAQIQGLADGSLRGPEGLAARDHVDACADCGAEYALYSALAGELFALQDPVVPGDFTAQVMAAVEVRETHFVQKRHTFLAALPAAALAILAIVGWALSSAPAAHVDRLLEGATVLRTVFGVLGPVVEAVRLPLALSALIFLAAVLAILARTLRGGGSNGQRAAVS